MSAPAPAPCSFQAFVHAASASATAAAAPAGQSVPPTPIAARSLPSQTASNAALHTTPRRPLQFFQAGSARLSTPFPYTNNQHRLVPGRNRMKKGRRTRALPMQVWQQAQDYEIFSNLEDLSLCLLQHALFLLTFRYYLQDYPEVPIFLPFFPFYLAGAISPPVFFKPRLIISFSS